MRAWQGTEANEPKAHKCRRRQLLSTTCSNRLQPQFLCACGGGGGGGAAYYDGGGGGGYPLEEMVGKEETVEELAYKATLNMLDLLMQTAKHKVEEDVLVAMGGGKPTGFLPLGTAPEASESQSSGGRWIYPCPTFS